MRTDQHQTDIDKARHLRSSVDRTVDAIIASGHLGQGDRRSSLLRYLVSEVLEGRGSRISSYGIAMDVFGRNESFDPKTDSIVRTEMGRLRAGLRLFFAETIETGLVEIEIPKGTYQPDFSPSQTPEGASKAPMKFRARSFAAILVIASALVLLLTLNRQWTPQQATGPTEGTPFDVVRIAVLPLSASGDNRNVEKLAFGLYSELSMDLSVYPWMSVVTPFDGPAPEGEANADFVLKGDLLWQDDQLLTNLQLISLPDQKLIWSKSLTVDTRYGAIEDARDLFVRQVVERLASFHGVAPALVQEQNARRSPASLEAYLCFMGIYQYIEGSTDALHRETRDCLERVTREFPAYGEAFAALAFLYMDEARQGRNLRPGSDPWAEAKAALDTALIYAPLRQLTLNVALIYSIESPDRDLKAFRQYAARLLELFPRHPDTLANVALRSSAMAGDWESGLSLTRHAIELQSSDPSWYFLPAAFHAVLTGEISEDNRALRKLTSDVSIPEMILRYIAYAKSENDQGAEEQRRALALLGHAENASIVQYVRDRRFDPALETALLEALNASFLRENGP